MLSYIPRLSVVKSNEGGFMVMEGARIVGVVLILIGVLGSFAMAYRRDYARATYYLLWSIFLEVTIFM